MVYNRLSRMVHFVETTEGMLVEELAQLFRDNVQKLHRLPESVVSDQGLYFAVEIARKLNKMLSIEMKLSTLFNLQTDGQTGKMNQEGKEKWKSDRICRNNKESVERSRSSIKESTRKNETISR